MISLAAFEARRVALQHATAVTEVVDLASQQSAASALTAVKSLLTQVEASRKSVKEPVIKVGKEIDATAAAFGAELETQAKRLALLVGAYQEAERRKASAAAEEAARKERDRLWRLEEEERQRLARETSGHTGNLLEDLDAIRQKAVEDVAAIRQDAANAAVAAPEGAQIRKNWKFEVTSIDALFKAHPELCTIAPNNAAIRAIIKHRQSIPGLRIWSETAAVVTSRATSALPAAVEAYDY